MRGRRIFQSCAVAAAISTIGGVAIRLSWNDVGLLFLFLTVMAYFTILGE